MHPGRLFSSIAPNEERDDDEKEEANISSMLSPDLHLGFPSFIPIMLLASSSDILLFDFPLFANFYQ